MSARRYSDLGRIYGVLDSVGALQASETLARVAELDRQLALLALIGFACRLAGSRR
jgi:hypothetical protein